MRLLSADGSRLRRQGHASRPRRSVPGTALTIEVDGLADTETLRPRRRYRNGTRRHGHRHRRQSRPRAAPAVRSRSARIPASRSPSPSTPWTPPLSGLQPVTSPPTPVRRSTRSTRPSPAFRTLRGELGAKQNRFESTINNLQVSTENIIASESRIRDTDMATEMTNFTKQQILQQAGTAMLGQANSLPQSVLRLLG